MKIDYEYAFVYFDNNDYEKAEEAMKRIASKNYVNAFPEDNSYILMQEGYLFMIKKNTMKLKKVLRSHGYHGKCEYLQCAYSLCKAYEPVWEKERHRKSRGGIQREHADFR
jgi:hypothetical protein